MAGLDDGIPSSQLLVESISGTAIQATSISGTTVTGASVAAGAGTIGNAELADNAASGTKVNNFLPIAGVGSPIAGGLRIELGSGAANTYIAFQKPFLAAPAVLVSQLASGAVGLFASNVSVGSFLPSGGGATACTYLAVGSGR